MAINFVRQWDSRSMIQMSMNIGQALPPPAPGTRCSQAPRTTTGSAIRKEETITAVCGNRLLPNGRQMGFKWLIN